MESAKTLRRLAGAAQPTELDGHGIHAMYQAADRHVAAWCMLRWFFFSLSYEYFGKVQLGPGYCSVRTGTGSERQYNMSDCTGYPVVANIIICL